MSQENIELQKSNDLLSNDLNIVQEKFVLLQKEKNELQSKCADLKKIVLKFSKVEENLNKILGSQKTSFNKEGIDFNPFNKKKCYKNFFVKSTNHKSSNSITCNYCCKLGHISTCCPIKINYHKVMQIWVAKGTRRPNMHGRQ